MNAMVYMKVLGRSSLNSRAGNWFFRLRARWGPQTVRSANNDLQIIHEVKTPGVFYRNSQEFASLFVRIFGVVFSKTGSVLLFSSLCILLNQFRDIVLFRTYIFFYYVCFQLMRHVPQSQPVSCHHLQRYGHWRASIYFNYLSQATRKSESSDKNPPRFTASAPIHNFLPIYHQVAILMLTPEPYDISKADTARMLSQSFLLSSFHFQ